MVKMMGRLRGGAIALSARIDIYYQVGYVSTLRAHIIINGNGSAMEMLAKTLERREECELLQGCCTRVSSPLLPRPNAACWKMPVSKSG